MLLVDTTFILNSEKDNVRVINRHVLRNQESGEIGLF